MSGEGIINVGDIESIKVLKVSKNSLNNYPYKINHFYSDKIPLTTTKEKLGYSRETQGSFKIFLFYKKMRTN